MTMQVRDVVNFEKKHWALWNLVGTGFFCPKDYGLDIAGAKTTACYRGYYSAYEVHENQLLLQFLEINVETPPKLNGCDATGIGLTPHGQNQAIRICGEYRYHNLQMPIRYSGGLVLCADHIEVPLGLGRELVWAFKNVRELIFKDGLLEESYERSESVNAIRDKVVREGEICVPKKFHSNASDTRRKYDYIEHQLVQCFKLNYSL